MTIPTMAETGICPAPESKKKGIRKTPHSAISRQIFHATLKRISFKVRSSSSGGLVSFFFQGRMETFQYMPSHCGIFTDNWTMQMAATTLETPSMISTTASSNSLPKIPRGTATAMTTMAATRAASNDQMVTVLSACFFRSSSHSSDLLMTVR